MKIGSHTLNSNLLLAPMAGITDPPFRQLCRQFGAGLATSEMLTSDISLWGSKKSIHRLPWLDESEPRSVQIAGTEPKIMAKAALSSIDRGAQIIDINMGCPAKKVCNKIAGSALMKSPKTAQAIISAVVKASSVPVTLKMRTGWSRKNRNALEIAKIAEQNNIAAISIHGRTRQDAYMGYAEFETIRRVKAAVSIPVIANGDLIHPSDLDFAINYTAADGLMIGRAAQGQPWIFQRYVHFLNTGKLSEDIDFLTKKKIILNHIKHIHTIYGERMGVNIARKHIGYYLTSLGVSDKHKLTIFRAKAPAEQVQILKAVLTIPPKQKTGIIL